MTITDLINGDPVRLEIRRGRHSIELEKLNPSALLTELAKAGRPFFRISVDGQRVAFTNEPEVMQEAFREVSRFASLAPDADLAAFDA